MVRRTVKMWRSSSTTVVHRKINDEPDVSVPFNKRREHSVLIMINIVIAIFLIYCALHTRCTTKFITDEFDSYICRIAVFAVVLNSAVNSLAYALFKQDIKN